MVVDNFICWRLGDNVFSCVKVSDKKLFCLFVFKLCVLLMIICLSLLNKMFVFV